jgi:phosphate ABC transporter phosphate-binding protein
MKRPLKQTSITGPLLLQVARRILLAMLIVLPASLQAQTASALNQVRKIYIETSGAKTDATEMQSHLTDDLRKDHSVEIVTDPSDADAILRASSAVWVKAYLSANPRSNGSKYPVYGGFLSAQLIGRDGEPLWSYLVTPTKYPSNGIRQNLADQLTKKLLAVLHEAAPAGSPGPVAQGIVIRAAGATFPAPLYQAWIDSYRERHPDVHITYSGIGSEAGLQQLHDQKITFAASDVPLSDAYMTQMPVKILQFATVIGAVVPIYHLPRAGQDLRFTSEVLAGIYLGKIRKWNDPAIRAINRSVNLPDAEIVVVHRSDGSGTTFAWTDFLSKTNPEWKAAVGSGTTVTWPVGKSAQGNDGLATMVDRTTNSIGYTELSFAIQRQLSYGTVRNAAGNFTQANLLTLAAAVESSAIPATSSVFLSLINAPGKDAYPIASFTWLLVPESLPDPATKSAVVDFIDWILTSGQKVCSALAYNPLPKEIVSRQLEQLSNFKSK